MSAMQSIDPADVICGLKAAVTALECHHNMQLLKQRQEKKKPDKSRQPPMYTTVPIQEDAAKHDNKLTCSDKEVGDREPEKRVKKEPRTGVPCDKAMKRADRKKDDYCDDSPPIANLNFPEMRGGILYSTCSCVHRDGLQDYCPLTPCQGQPECMARPWPCCPPGRLTRQRFPELYPPPSTTA